MHKTLESEGISGFLDIFFPSTRRNSESHVCVVVKSLEGKSNKEQLRELWVFSLEKRKPRGDLISVF